MSEAVLLDTHTLFWFDTEPERLSRKGLARIRDRSTQVYVSAITAWELSIKHHLEFWNTGSSGRYSRG
jgi:PIN domain nuclease of toxin-antitoxin system